MLINPLQPGNYVWLFHANPHNTSENVWPRTLCLVLNRLSEDEESEVLIRCLDSGGHEIKQWVWSDYIYGLTKDATLATETDAVIERLRGRF